MAITFTCPNGHRLSCPDDRAGRVGKCPKCGQAFRVPAPDGSEAAASDSGVSDSQITLPPTDEPAISVPPLPAAGAAATQNAAGGAANDPTTAAGKDRIVFLCPNGHKLNGPASLQGRPGKCPHCGATFLIPDYNEISLEEEEDLGPLEQDLIDEEPQAPPTTAAAPEFLARLTNDDLPFNFVGLNGDSAAAYSDHAMARLFNDLWRTRGSGIVEIHLKGGAVVSPDWFSPQHSLESCAMFGIQDADGSYTLTAIRWDAMERVAVRGLEDFPDGMFG